MIRDAHAIDRPRERLRQNGAQQLTNQELLAIIFRVGIKNLSVTQLAANVLTHFEHLHDIKEATIEELIEINGIGEVKAIELLAAIELGRRVSAKQVQDRWTIRTPDDAATLLMSDMTNLKQEHFVVLYLNVKNQVIHKQTIFMGSLNASIVHPREIFREAVKRSAASIICAHNHPSGNPTPSSEDIDVTKRIQHAGEVLGIELLDHVIIGDHQFISLKEKGFM
ncbi:MAG: DNA repair protein RadC [Candidatus Kurthia intestinigallinarum]|uniref:RadC family protein n=1 Tax=Kurthia sp. Dielmo TaxID=1033738 RepID=UPI00112164AF|nr:DNA repair protein RadC [Kurthia sp. Dielmo]